MLRNALKVGSSPRLFASVQTRSFFFNRKRRYIGSQDPFGRGAMFLAGALGAGSAVYTVQPTMKKQSESSATASSSSSGVAASSPRSSDPPAPMITK
mmetsp:Transcript_9436/g.25595  ORF Transcript_9436/g.25595 Transcript_9436/m.25595 type:complete len:97 (+) Transcript_9436:385-675(+)